MHICSTYSMTPKHTLDAGIVSQIQEICTDLCIGICPFKQLNKTPKQKKKQIKQQSNTKEFK